MRIILFPRPGGIIHHCHHPYRRREYLPEEFKKLRPPTFDGDMKKLEDVEA